MVCTYEEYLKRPKAITFAKNANYPYGNDCRDWHRYGCAGAI